ncbi:DNA primase [Candidatus Uhrbacteria bacterium CG_4_10_14_0_2_um_filter_41_7]|uniref:DNA primase n=1 Tax=Candidatus Uhrbacteria bacterium CG_4_9_14_3_um_filter_41_35 TaxID=1975034 RepID=A0A2M7XEZ0_9BACT|nr:MAG: DNA primase [Candidatus Uhrbacteria bacterium CG11_big_fil_rev_8_21_14_0_20_41_9]PIZ54792.1 MAG: DNA primase [Candidatus Uhrbacteria bacterium CG_4_10_14_0_2_um_filter_41_7]PJA46449.1 MAG: DNA primase [Candidatus Uhrbacteria bacterium CG_4_9_14_3_um_filter_41_35]
MDAKDEIKERLDIVEVISGYIELKNAGSGSHKALCPFHGENSPSFYVSEPKGIWHCFGCDKGGDAISFVMEIENLTFPEALQLLGKKVGVKIPEYKPQQGSDEKQFLLDMHELAGKFYAKLLHEHASGATARAYLKKRGISSALAKKFRLGVAPDNWDALSRVFQKRGYGETRLILAGLAKKKTKGNGILDRFRNRLLVPLCDPQGNILGFTGRTLALSSEEQMGPKYLNSPETPIYSKSKVIFGLDLAKMGIRQAKSVIVVEGNLDVIASHKAGVENVVASSGTAFTEDQLKLLKKYTNKIIFSFDSDNAGFKAAQRGIGLAQNMGFDISVISIPKELGKDPDDVVQNNPEAWKKLAEAPVHIVEYYFTEGLKKFDISKIEGKKDFANFILSELAKVTDLVEREHWLMKLSDILRIDVTVLRQVIAGEKQEVIADASAQTQSAPVNDVPTAKIQQKVTRSEKSAEFLIGLVLLDSEFTNEIFQQISESDLPTEKWLRIYKNVVLLYTGDEWSDSTQSNFFSFIVKKLTDNDPHEDLSILRRAMLVTLNTIHNLEQEHVREELNRHIEILASKSLNQKKKILEAAIREAERSGDKDRLNQLLREFTKLL